MTTLRALLAAGLVIISFGFALAKLPPPPPMDDKAKAAADLAEAAGAACDVGPICGVTVLPIAFCSAM